MASGDQVFEPMTIKDLQSREEIESVKEYLQKVMKKNQDLEEMLLYTTQELEKEKENSRKIVQTLTGRLMESREIINKLEVENMRYKKDCILAVELLQCNKSVDQDRVSSTVKKLLNYTVPDAVVGHHAYPTGKAIAADDAQIRPRTLSEKKTMSEDSNEDTTALLVNQDRNEAKMLRQLRVWSVDSANQDSERGNTSRIPPGLGKKQCEQMTERAGQSAEPFVPMVNKSKEKQSDDSRDMTSNEQNINDYGSKNRFLKEKGRLTDEYRHELEDKPLIANVQTENKDTQVDVGVSGAVDPEKSPNEAPSCPKSEAECFSDEWPQDDKPLILNVNDESTTNTPEANGNMKPRTEELVNVCPAKSKNSVMREQNKEIEEGRSVMSINNEHQKLLTFDDDAERSEGKHHSQEIASEINTAPLELASLEEENSIHLQEKIGKMMVSTDVDGDDKSDNDVDGHDAEKFPMDNSRSSEIEAKLKDEEKGPTVSETDEETLTAEENTPLV